MDQSSDPVPALGPSADSSAMTETPAQAPPPAATPQETSTWLQAIVLVPVLAALAASALLLVDYTRTNAVFCNDEGAGCSFIRQSAYSHVRGIPTPALGIVGFCILLILAAVRGPIARRLFFTCAVGGGVLAANFIAVQQQLGHFCIYCMVTDIAALLTVPLASLRLARKWELPFRLRGRAGVVALGVAMVAGLLAFGYTKKAPPPPKGLEPLPTVIADEIAKTPAGQVCVVDFIDFECPFCRELHEQLRPQLASRGGRVHLVRKHVPLRMHPHAEGAARAGICAEAVGQGDAMADKLVTMNVESMDVAHYVSAAKELGIEPDLFVQCMQSSSTNERIEADKAFFKAVKGHGLPTLFIGTERIDGLPEDGMLEGIVARGFGETR